MSREWPTTVSVDAVVECYQANQILLKALSRVDTFLYLFYKKMARGVSLHRTITKPENND